jgi:hypothetical protein
MTDVQPLQIPRLVHANEYSGTSDIHKGKENILRPKITGLAIQLRIAKFRLEQVEELLETKHLAHLSESVIEDYAEKADSIATDL